MFDVETKLKCLLNVYALPPIFARSKIAKGASQRKALDLLRFCESRVLSFLELLLPNKKAVA